MLPVDSGQDHSPYSACSTILGSTYCLPSVSPDPMVSLSNWLAQRPDLYRKIIVASELKWEIRDKLDQATIDERVLFPVLDGLIRWLRWQYVQPNGILPQSGLGGYMS